MNLAGRAIGRLERNPWELSLLGSLLLLSCAPKEGATQNGNSSVKEQEISIEVTAWLNRYGKALDDPDQFRRSEGSVANPRRSDALAYFPVVKLQLTGAVPSENLKVTL